MADSDAEVVPADAEATLFAEDLVNYVTFNLMSNTYVPTRAVRYRNVVTNHFTPVVRVAANFLCVQLDKHVIEDFDRIKADYDISIDAYRRYKEYAKTLYRMVVFNAKSVLSYSVHLSMMAAKFSLNGVLEAPELAVTGIVEEFTNREMPLDAWRSVHSLASTYARVYIDMDNVPSPESDLDSSSTGSSANDASKDCNLEFGDVVNGSHWVDVEKDMPESD